MVVVGIWSQIDCHQCALWMLVFIKPQTADVLVKLVQLGLLQQKVVFSTWWIDFFIAWIWVVPKSR